MAMRDMLTEEEASTKRCPRSFGPSSASTDARTMNISGGSNTTEQASPIHCIASNCMFWRWTQQDSNGTPTGFCGGAGQPKYL